MKYVSIFSVTLKSAMTPSFIGLMATTLPGVRPSISLASRPTATTSPVALLMATIEGSFTRSEEHTSELQSRGHLVCRLLLEKKKKEGEIKLITNIKKSNSD